MQKSTAETRHQPSISDSASTTEAPTKTVPRLIAIAVSLVGDPRKVMEEMRCSKANFLSYSSGEKDLLSPERDRLISIIVREQRIVIAENREIWNAMRARVRPQP